MGEHRSPPTLIMPAPGSPGGSRPPGTGTVIRCTKTLARANRPARVERRSLPLPCFLHLPEHLTATCLVLPDWPVSMSDRLEKPEAPETRRIGSELGQLETDPHVALRPCCSPRPVGSGSMC